MCVLNLTAGKKLLLSIAAHEIGHSLGVGHSRDETAMMYDIYNAPNPTIRLQPDDIAAIQHLYGKSQRHVLFLTLINIELNR